MNKEIPYNHYVFRRVPLSLYLVNEPEHRLIMDKNFFRNEKGNGMSCDWEAICKDPNITRTRNKDKKDHDKFGVIILNISDIKEILDYPLKVISDQIGYKCHCLLLGIPLSLSNKELRKKSREERNLYSLKKTNIRQHLESKAAWVIPFKASIVKNPHNDFNYFENLTSNIKLFFKSRNYQIPGI